MALAQWWEKFQFAELPEKEELMTLAKNESTANAASGVGKSRRRRRKASKQPGIIQNTDALEQDL